MPQLQRNAARWNGTTAPLAVVARGLTGRPRGKVFQRIARDQPEAALILVGGRRRGSQREACGTALEDRTHLENTRGRHVTFYGVRKRLRREFCDKFECFEGVAGVIATPDSTPSPQSERGLRIREANQKIDALYDEIGLLTQQRETTNDPVLERRLIVAYEELRRLQHESAMLMSAKFRSRFPVPGDTADILHEARQLLRRYEDTSPQNPAPCSPSDEKA